MIRIMANGGEAIKSHFRPEAGDHFPITAARRMNGQKKYAPLASVGFRRARLQEPIDLCGETLLTHARR